MRVFRKTIFLFLCLISTYVTPKTEQEEALEYLQYLGKMAQASQNSEFAQFSKKVTQISEAFENKYKNKPRLKCVTCKKYTLTHGELIGQIFVRSMDAFIEIKKPNAAKNLMVKAFEIFPTRPLDELTAFMLCAANELQLGCVKCSGKHWGIIKDLSSSCAPTTELQAA